jgi:hypothetical protein
MQADIRDELVALVQPAYATAYPGAKLVVDNQPFDWNNPPESFTTFEIKFQGGCQIGMAADAKDRVRGHVYVTAYVRLGTGSKTALQTLDWFRGVLSRRAVGRLQLQAAEPAGDGKAAGYFFEQLKVPFYSDQA